MYYALYRKRMLCKNSILFLYVYMKIFYKKCEKCKDVMFFVMAI